MSERIEEIKRVLTAATPGPWKWWGDSKLVADNHNPDDENDYVMEAAIGEDDFGEDELFVDIGEDDAHLIAKAPEYISYLLQEIECFTAKTSPESLGYGEKWKQKAMEAREERDRLRKELEEAQSQMAVKNEELKTAYDALDELQEEFNQLDKGAAEDYQKLVEAQQTIAFYADEGNYKQEKTPHDDNDPLDFYYEQPEVLSDGGRRAREYLQSK